MNGVSSLQTGYDAIQSTTRKAVRKGGGMGKIAPGRYSHMGQHVPGSKEGAAAPITKGPGYKAGGSKLGSGGKLKAMMIWHDTGKKGRY